MIKTEPLIKIESIRKYFPVKKGIFGKDMLLKAVDDVTLEVGENSVVGIVGESGSGKSTLARIATALEKPTSGDVLFGGKSVFALDRQEMLAFRRAVQIIFQDPFASLNPRATVFETIAEPLRIHRLGGKGRHDLAEKVAGLLAEVGLGREALHRYPHEFSGGQRQRICIARALAVSPRLVVADEPLSALDVSIQAQILNILSGLKDRDRLSFLFISHDLRVVEYLSDVVCVMYLGKIVEKAGAENLFETPLHPYTVGLFASAPALKTKELSAAAEAKEEFEEKKETPKGDIPSPIEIPPGCPFHPRCPRRFAPCDKVVPSLAQPSGKPGRLVSCHLWNTY